MISNNSVKEYYDNEKKKIINSIDSLDKLITDTNIEYSIIKLQELNLNLKNILDSMNNNNNIDEYVNNEYKRRDKMSELLPIFTYIYMHYNK
jgi:hypothetical protein